VVERFGTKQGFRLPVPTRCSDFWMVVRLPSHLAYDRDGSFDTKKVNELD
jgi:hypothetical protein